MPGEGEPEPEVSQDPEVPPDVEGAVAKALENESGPSVPVDSEEKGKEAGNSGMEPDICS